MTWLLRAMLVILTAAVIVVGKIGTVGEVSYSLLHALFLKCVQDSKVVVSLTTSPKRIYFLEPVLDSINRQTYKPDKIYLHLPKVFKRDGSTYKIPEFLNKYPNLIINRTKYDYGPATKLIGALFFDNKPDTIIITIDDDIYYHPDMIASLLNRMRLTKNSAAGISAAMPIFLVNKDSKKFARLLPMFANNMPGVILEGFAGVAYRKDMFDYSIADVRNENIYCYLSDDLYISNYLMGRGVNTTLINTPEMNRLFMAPLPHGLQKDALQNGAGGLGMGGNIANYAACSHHLHLNKKLNIAGINVPY